MNQLTHADEHAVEFRYVCLERGPMAEKLLAAGARVTVLNRGLPWSYPRTPLLLPLVWLKSASAFWAAYRCIRKELERDPPHVVYAHQYYTHLLSGLAAKRMGCASVAQIHGTVGCRRFWGLQRVILSLALAGTVDALVSISNHARLSLWGPAARKAVVIYNGIDTEAIKRVAKATAKVPGRLVIVGRILVDKKQAAAIQAVGFLRAEGLECSLDIIGGPVDAANAYYRRLQELVGALGLEDRVRFTGVVSPPYQLVAAAEAAVNCSTMEAFGLTVTEAMACGTPVVVADAAGPGELVAHERTGLKFDADEPASLATALRRLLTDSDLRKRLATAAAEDVVCRFDIASHMRAVRAVFEKHRRCRQ